MPIKQYENVEAECFELKANPADCVWHVRRPGPPMQPTLCGQLYVRPGEKAPLGKLGPEFVCPTCLNRMEVVR